MGFQMHARMLLLDNPAVCHCKLARPLHELHMSLHFAAVLVCSLELHKCSIDLQTAQLHSSRVALEQWHNYICSVNVSVCGAVRTASRPTHLFSEAAASRNSSSSLPSMLLALAGALQRTAQKRW